ncbi:helix-turn-helix transcriptional regulator [Chromobacterium sp. IIBBL 290-4]|uniref:helix-turn-helix transcriptional regulator n=1 Tax=Chromobacterium sp. IIBBL 290-4 TaxID=2953890 RepID=UPI0020B84A51|nr:helix-turn-helix transcriptional regulator [Chromobacterium sp. IIBBL 290-4]UTH73805.1 helix-turn-helix transcriptional regulator [Chromobacterium sp. IIBBL 290-4]
MLQPDACARPEQLGDFLRSRRENLRPDQVGLPTGMRRRTPGLRREEVAMLADVGTAWYTWLEQGRDIRASAGVLASLAEALRLDDAERRHLFLLGGHEPPLKPGAEADWIEPPLQRMLDQMGRQAAYITGRRWDVLAWNRNAAALFCDYGQLPRERRNLMRLVFTDAAHKRLLLDWETLARSALAMFRADFARYAGDESFAKLIHDISSQSEDFRRWWPLHEVLAPLSHIKRIRHPDAGDLSFEYCSFALMDGSDRRLTIYTPVDEDGSADKLARLAS